MSNFNTLDSRHNVIESETINGFSFLYADGIEESISTPRVVLEIIEEPEQSNSCELQGFDYA